MTKPKKDNLWHWPRYSPRFDDRSDRKELTCRHGVGHGGIHGCDGCCSDPEFQKRYNEEYGSKQKRRKS